MTPEPDSADKLLKDVAQQLRDDIGRAEELIYVLKDKLRKVENIISRGTADPKRPTVGPFRYANMTFIEAALAYLDRTERPWKREELIAEIVDGGVYAGRGKGGDATVQANKSLEYFLMRREKKQEKYGKRIEDADPKLRQVGELIGKADWRDEKFNIS